MMIKVVQYARVSTEKQTGDDKVSIPQQLANMESFVQRQPGWTTVATFTDEADYIATNRPKKGKKINPSGTRDDRPGLLAMLELVRTGEIDVILTAFDDRLYRHEKVVTLILNALEEGESKRRGKEIEIWQCSSKITKDFMYLQAMIWRKENERRKERFANGRAGTLLQGRWPGQYLRLGYNTVKEEGKRGVAIVLADEAEVQAVKTIFQWCDTGLSIGEIRRKLISMGIPPKGSEKRPKKRDWAFAVISDILHARDYTGIATWTFGDGTEQAGKSYTINIPRIIEDAQFERVQKRLGHNGINSQLSGRNAQHTYLLQGIGFCGECGAKLTCHVARYNRKVLADGTIKRYVRKEPQRRYRCNVAANYNGEGQPYPYSWRSPDFDNDLWCFIADSMVTHPELITEQVKNRQAELIDQGDSLDSDIGILDRKLASIEEERIAYTRQLGRGKLKEKAYDVLMAECDEVERDTRDELAHLKALRDNAASIQSGLEYAYNLMTSIQRKLPEINQTPEELAALPEAHRQWVLSERQKIVRALCDKVSVFANGKVVIEGFLDGGEVSQFDLTNLHPG